MHVQQTASHSLYPHGHIFIKSVDQHSTLISVMRVSAVLNRHNFLNVDWSISITRIMKIKTF